MRTRWVRRTILGLACVTLAAADAAAQVHQQLERRTRAYVANRGASSLSVIDVLGGTVLKTVALEAPPYDVAVVRGQVYVSMPTVNRLAVVDPLSLTVVGAVAVPGAPRDLDRRLQSFEPRLYIATDDGLRVYHADTGTLAPAIAVGPGTFKAIEAGNANFSANDVYVAACDGGAQVRLVTEPAGTVSAPVATGSGPCAVQRNPGALYVANRDSDTISVFTPTLQSPISVPVAAQPIAMAEFIGDLWVASASGTLTRLDGLTHGVASTHVIGGVPTDIAIAETPSGSVAVVADAGGSLRVYAATGAFIRAIPTGAQPGAIAIGNNNPGDPISVSTAGEWANDYASGGAMSLDGRFVTFISTATNLVPGDGNDVVDVFVRDRLLKRTVRVSVSSAGIEADQASFGSQISADGRYVAFASNATNLVAGDANGRQDLFVHDRDTDADGLFDEAGQIATRRVTVRSDGSEATCQVPGAGNCAAFFDVALSGNGRHVVFTTFFELEAADQNGVRDVYAHDTVTGRTTRLSLRPGGASSPGHASMPVISADGRVVAFSTDDAGMVGYDHNGRLDVFAIDRDADGNGVFDEQPPVYTHISLLPGGSSFTTDAFPVAISDDRRWVAYAASPYLGIFDRSTGHNARLYDGLSLVAFGAGQFSANGRYLAYYRYGPSFSQIDRDVDADGLLDEDGQTNHDVHVSVIFAPPGRLTDAAQRLVVTQSTDTGVGLVVVDRFGPAPPSFDTDLDGLEDEFESLFGLSAASAAGDDGPDGDPDGDGVTNAQEQLAGTHPRGFEARYLAEGATGAFFSTRIAVANPGTTAASVLLRYQTDTGQTTSTPMVVPGRARRFVNLGSVASLASANVSTIVESDAPVVVDRTMFWSSGFYGSHAEASLPNPSTTWFLAEGATHGAFDLFYLLQNPDPTQPAQVEVRFLRASGAPIVRTYVVPAARRLTIYVDQVAGLEAADVSAAFTSTNAVPIIVERAMYYSSGTPFAAGHGSAGVTAPATRWFLAEGATGGFFDLFVLLANPSDTAANVQLTYLRPNGAPIVKTRTLPANSRQTIYVESEDALLVDTPVSTIVETTNGVAIVVERAMWWPAVGGWQEAHNSPGATTAATRWGFADGEVGGPPFHTQTYFLIANSSSEAATVRVMLLFDDGTAPVERTYIVPGNSRFNVPAASEFPAAVGKGFGALIESLGAAPVPIVVERAMYSDAGGITWAAGTDALGTALPQP